MSPNEVAIIIETNRPKNKGAMHEDEFDDLARKRQKLIDDGINVL